MINNVVLVGRLGNDPELKHTSSGTAVTNFRLAVSRPPQRNAPEGSKEQTDWLDIVTWGRVAENCAQYLDKGALVAIEGRVQSRTWQTQDGQKRYAVEINGRNELLHNNSWRAKPTLNVVAAATRSVHRRLRPITSSAPVPRARIYSATSDWR